MLPTRIQSQQRIVIVLLLILSCGRNYSCGTDTFQNFAEGQPTDRSLLDLFFNTGKCRCGVPNRDARQERILGGEFLQGYEFPWLALIQTASGLPIPATLINNKYIISSASKLIGLTPFDVKITLGQFDRCIPDVSSTNVSVDRIVLHPDYTAANRAHDLALLKLSTPATFQKRIASVCLSFPGYKYLGQVATVLGWSEASNPEVPENVHKGTACRPRKTGLPVLGSVECMGTAADSTYVSKDKGCVGVVGAPSIVCEADAGGPVLFRSHKGVYELIGKITKLEEKGKFDCIFVGVLSDKNECGKNASTALYTSINEHLSWITENTRDASYCIKA